MLHPVFSPFAVGSQPIARFPCVDQCHWPEFRVGHDADRDFGRWGAQRIRSPNEALHDLIVVCSAVGDSMLNIIGGYRRITMGRHRPSPEHQSLLAD
jgi:hypothetical protein